MKIKKEILIVDDEVDFRLDLAEALVDHGYKVTTAHNGEEALNYILKGDHSPDLITVDVNMPVKDGMKLREELLKLEKHIPIIMISGFMPQHLSKLDGIRAFFSKPLNRMEFLNVLQDSI